MHCYFLHLQIFSFYIFLHHSNIPTHQSHVGALKALVGIEHILSGGETSSTSAMGTTMDTILMTVGYMSVQICGV